MELILGHNQFIGISHISEDRAREREKRFSDVKNIFEVVKNAHKLGYEGMMIETHPRMVNFFEYYKENSDFDTNFYLQLPYVQGYVQKMNEKGAKGIINEVVDRTGYLGAGNMALKSGWNYLKKDYLSVGLNFLKLEKSAFEDVNVEYMFLHNVVTDLFLSLGLKEAFEKYLDFVENKMDTKPALITLNFPLLVEKIEEWDLKKPSYVMTPVNPKGYDMNPSREEVEKNLERYDGNIMAMNILGGGAFSPEEANEYLSKFSNIRKCVIGASSYDHLKENKEIFGG